jgi:hypothetical protein
MIFHCLFGFMAFEQFLAKFLHFVLFAARLLLRVSGSSQRQWKSDHRSVVCISFIFGRFLFVLGLTSLVVLVRGVNDVVLRSRAMSQEVSLYAAPTLAAHQVNALVFFDPPVQPLLHHAPRKWARIHVLSIY